MYRDHTVLHVTVTIFFIYTVKPRSLELRWVEYYGWLELI